MKRIVFAVLVGLSVWLSQVAEGAKDARPNILVVLFDDLGFSDLGCYGGEIKTPNIDQLGRQGLRFTRMTNSARCCPSRASLLTGLHPGQTGIPNMGGSLVKECVTLADVLKGAGYSTYGVGKWHVGSTPESIPTARGFDQFYGFVEGHSQHQWNPGVYHRFPEGTPEEFSYREGEFYATDVFTDYAVEFLKQAQKKDRPWFMYLAHSAPHFPVQAPMESAEPYLDTYRQGWDILRAERFERMGKSGLINHAGWKLPPRSLVPVDTPAIANGYPGKPNPAWNSLDADRREDLAHRMALFAAMVGHVDRGIGRVVGQLEKAGQLDNTIIMILSDNGACYEWGPFGFDGKSRQGITKLNKGADLKKMGGPDSYMSYGSAWAMLGNTPFRLYKHFTHQGGIVTPFIFHWPAKVEKPGRWVREPAHIVDLMATVVDISGAEYPKMFKGSNIPSMEGTSLLPLVQVDGGLPSRTLCYQHQGARAIQKGKWKLVLGKKYPTEVAWELYDLAVDPCETRDLAKQHPEVVDQLTVEWEAWAQRTRAIRPAKKNRRKKKQ